MGIFTNLKREKHSRTTKGFYFGHTEAEGENKVGSQNLDHYFEDYLNVIPQIADEKFIFVGRKGTGKSAIAKFIKDASDKDEASFCDLINFNDIKLEQVVQAIPKENADNVEEIIFEWLILVRLIRLLIKNEEAIYTKEHSKLKNFIERNAGFIEIDKYHVVEIVQKKKLEISIEVLKHVFGPTLGKYVDSKTVKAPFYQFVNPLKEIISQVLPFEVYQNKEYILLFDDLDVKFKSEDKKSIEKLLSLLRAVRNLNTTLFRNSKVKILVFLRDDITEILETSDSDTSKLFSSYQIQLSWYDHDNYKLSENQTNLKRFLNKRVSINFEANNITYRADDPWLTLMEPNYYHYEKSSFKYILDYTFYRPRDLILFLSPIGKEEYTYPIESKTIRVLLIKYINETVKELRSELSIHFTPSEIDNIFNICKKISLKNSNTKGEIEELIKNSLSNRNLVDKVFNHLVSYSLIVYRDPGTGKLFFNYRERSQYLVDSEKMNYTLHKCLYHYFYPEMV